MSNKLAIPTAALVSFHKRHAEQTAYLSTLTKSIHARCSSDSNTYVSFRCAWIDSAIKLCISLSCFIFPNPPVSSSRRARPWGSRRLIQTSFLSATHGPISAECGLHPRMLEEKSRFMEKHKRTVMFFKPLNCFCAFYIQCDKFCCSISRRVCALCPRSKVLSYVSVRAYGVTRSWHSSLSPVEAGVRCG